MENFKERLKAIEEETAHLNIANTVRHLCAKFPEKVCFSTSFGKEDQALSHIIFNEKLPVKTFTLDTGRLFQETYDVMDETRERYGKQIDIYFPDQDKVESMVNKKGPNSFYRSVDNRKECCHIRKVEPLQRALKGHIIWITGLMGDQSEFRKQLPTFEYDANFKVIKYNPLINWERDYLENFIEEHQIPVNKLHEKGFVSIGCKPCTRAIKPGEDFRAGRWWWEESKKECGLHLTKTNNS